MQELEKILEDIEQCIAIAKKVIVRPPHDKLDEIANDTAEAFIEAYKECQDIIRKHMNDGNDINVAAKDDGWIPVERELPKDDKYFLLSFSNSSLPMVGRYDRDEEGGGAFYLGDCDEQDTCIANDLYVNAWQPLPEPYRPERRKDES